MKKLDFSGKKKSVIVFIVAVAIAAFIIVPETSAPQESSQESMKLEETASSGAYDDKISDRELEKMNDENQNKRFYVWSDNNGSWEEIALIGDNKYTYIITKNGQQEKNCTGYYELTSDGSFYMGYGGEYLEGFLKDNILHIFDRDFELMTDSHM